MFKLCIFDLDGTVLDTLHSIATFGNGALRENGLPTLEEEKYRYFAGDGARVLIRRMLEHLGCFSESLHGQVYDSYIRDYHADATVGARHFEGLPEVLERLAAEGITLAIVSNKPYVAANHAISVLFRDGLFSHVQGAQDGVPFKPDPTATLAVMERFGVRPDECAFIGDTSTDMDTAKNAGVHAVGVLWGFRDREELVSHGADFVCETPEQLYRVLRGEDA